MKIWVRISAILQTLLVFLGAFVILKWYYVGFLSLASGNGVAGIFSIIIGIPITIFLLLSVIILSTLFYYGWAQRNNYDSLFKMFSRIISILLIIFCVYLIPEIISLEYFTWYSIILWLAIVFYISNVPIFYYAWWNNKALVPTEDSTKNNNSINQIIK